MKRPHVSIVIPTLNEQRNIRPLINGINRIIKPYSHEIIIVDGNSTDKTASIAEAMGATVLEESIGKGYALRKGIRAAKGDIIVSMDADLSNKPNELRLLIAGIETGYDICTGSRFLTGGGSDEMPFIRKLGNKMFVHLVNLLYGSHYTDMCYGYRSLSRGVVRRLNLKDDGFGIETEINIKAQKMHLKILEVPSYEKQRQREKAKLRGFRDGYVILKTIFRNL
jgi:glycosyltransferase involved in cell wall biosynthesis